MDRRCPVIIIMLLLLTTLLTGCGSDPNPGPAVGAGLCVIGLSLIVAKLVERVKGKGGDHE